VARVPSAGILAGFVLALRSVIIASQPDLWNT